MTTTYDRDPPHGADRADTRDAGVGDASGRGHEARRPKELGRDGWKDVLARVRVGIKDDNLSIVAAGVAFYGLLSVFPALAAVVSIFGLAADPVAVQEQMATMAGMMPAEAHSILAGRLDALVTAAPAALGFGAAFSILLALWSANKGMKALVTALNIAYGEPETRGFLKLNAVTLLLTLAGVVLAIVTLALVILLPALINVLPLGDVGRILASLLRWPLLLAAVLGALVVLYRVAPNRRSATWRWVAPGSVVATTLWIIASIGLSLYVQHFGSFDETYGSLGAVIILLLWFFLTAFVILLGAEINAEAEHQTREDTTVGPDRPMGSRGARMADTLP